MSEKTCQKCSHVDSCYMLRLIYEAIGVLKGLEPFYKDDMIGEMVRWANGMANFCRYYSELEEKGE